MINISELKFDSRGLIPAIVVESGTNKVLMLAYMSKESLEISIEKGYTCFWSRSRQELWLKGDTSGNYQHIVSITADCDCDTLLVEVIKDGPACHTGSESCFFNTLSIGPNSPAFKIDTLMDKLKSSDIDSASSLESIKKASENLSDASKSTEIDSVINELGNIVYNCLAIMAENDISFSDIDEKLSSLL